MFRKSMPAMGVLAVFGAFALTAASYDGRLGRFNHAHAFWKVPDWHIYAPCFLAGVWLFYNARQAKAPPVLPPIALPIGIAALFLPMMATQDLRKFIPATLLMAILIPYCREIKPGWAAGAARILVRYSYSIYLLHLFAIWVAFIKLGGQSRPVQWVAFGAALTVVSAAGYHVIEHPMIRLGNRIAVWLEANHRPIESPR